MPGGRVAVRCLPEPSAEHPADLVEFFRNGDIFFDIECADLPEDLEEKFKEVESCRCFLNIRRLLIFSQIAGDKDGFTCFYEKIVDFRAERITGIFGNMRDETVPELIGADKVRDDGEIRAGRINREGIFIHYLSMKIQFEQNLEYIASTENLLEAWREFLPGKRSKLDVQNFNLHLIDNLLSLKRDLVNRAYRHGGYEAFNISDPKPRNIHKASVRDRLLHHAIYRVLYPFFDKTFIADSYSCRLQKGSYKAIARFDFFYRKASRNDTRTVWVLKCDIRKFFASIDHAMLMEILAQYITNKDILELLQNIIDSFSSTAPGVGLPLGNLTSQLLVNIYMNEFDQFAKHVLRAKYYIRYADDFVFLSTNRDYLEIILTEMRCFLSNRLKLTLHPDKTFITAAASGVDFLGWVIFPDHKVIRTATKWRMIKRLEEMFTIETASSYRGLLKHGNAHKLSEKYLPDTELAIFLDWF